MIVIKHKRNKLGSVLSTIDPALPIQLDSQHSAVANWSAKSAKLFIIGPSAPQVANGTRFIRTGPTPPIHNLLGTYLQSIPGSEVCMISSPDCVISDVMPLLNHIDAQKMELAWASHVDFGVTPSVFFLSSPVIAHMLNDIPRTLTFQQDWRAWVHGWFQRLLRHRYFDATSFSPVVEVLPPPPQDPSPIAPETPKEEPPTQQADELSSLTMPSKRKKGPLKKVKVA